MIESLRPPPRARARRRRIAWALVVACTVPAALLPPTAAAAVGPEVGAMTYNIKGNVAFRDGDWNPAAVASVLSAQNADVIGLQEVCDWQLADLVTRLQAQGWEHSAHRTTVGSASCGNFGIGLLSKLPLADVQSTALPQHNEARAVLSATVEVGGLPVRLFDTHLSPGAGLLQTQALAAAIAGTTIERKVVMADLNVEPSNATALQPLLDASLREIDFPLNRPTFSATNPTRKLDYVFVSEPIAAGGVTVPQTTASDHLPLRGDLDLGADPVPAGNGAIAFTSERDGNAEIYSMTAAGGSQARLTENTDADNQPAWSPDGTRIAFTSDREGDREIYAMNADGSGVTQLTTNTDDDQEPAWSPDGTRIAFRTDRTGDNEIFAITASGGSPTNLTDDPASDFAPDWSPGGTRIAFQRFRPGSGVGFGNEVIAMNADGGGQINLTSNGNSINDGRPAWSPDGTGIAFHSNRAGDFEIYTMSSNGVGVTRRTMDPATDQLPDWSPDGDQLTFNSDRDGDVEIYAQPLNGGDPDRLTTSPGSDSEPSWQPDSEPPETTIDAGPPDSTAEGTATFSFSASEDGSSFECRLDAAAFVPCESPHTSPSLAEGPHSFEVRATDPAGNAGAAAVHDWEIDLTAPAVEIDPGSAPADPSNSTEAAFEFAVDDPSATVGCRIDTEAFAPCGSPQEYADLDEGPHTFVVRATDAAGNAGEDSRAWEVDLTAPETEIADGPSGPTNQRVSTFAFASSDDPAAAFECRLAPGAWETCTSPFETEELAEGSHTFEVRAIDPAGNPDPSPADSAFVVDLTSPALEIETGPTGAVASESAEFTFSASDAVGSSPALECGWDTEAFLLCSSPDARGDLAQGAHTFRVRATDEAGNAATAERSWSVDTVAPTATITSAPPSPSASTAASFAFASNELGASFQCGRDGDGLSGCTSPLAYSGLAPGDHRFRVRAIDPAGNVGAPATHAWRIVPPSSAGDVAAAATEKKKCKKGRKLVKRKGKRRCVKRKGKKRR